MEGILNIVFGALTLLMPVASPSATDARRRLGISGTVLRIVAAIQLGRPSEGEWLAENERRHVYRRLMHSCLALAHQEPPYALRQTKWQSFRIPTATSALYVCRSQRRDAAEI